MTKFPLKSSDLTFSDARLGERREFVVPKIGRVANVAHGLVIVEADAHSACNNGASVAHLVATACDTFSVATLLLSIEPRPRSMTRTWAPPVGWHLLTSREDCMVLQLAMHGCEFLCSVFESHANWGLWSFAAPASHQEAVSLLRGCDAVHFESALVHAERWSFVMTFDLDGMLLGFLKASKMFDAFKAALFGGHDDR